jgi:beta-glucosidase
MAAPARAPALALALALAPALVLALAAPAPYKDAALPVPARVADLVSRLSLEEKVAQLLHPWGGSTPEELFAQYPLGLGATYIFWASNSTTPEGVLADRNRMQRLFVENSPHNIPVSFVQESLHGGGFGGTLFPMPVNFAQTLNLSLAALVYRVVAADMRARGADRAFSPVVNIFADARYGRLAEGFSEDVFVTTAFALAIVDAMQGGQRGGPETYLADFNSAVTCTVKHFVRRRACDSLNVKPAERSLTAPSANCTGSVR